MAKVITSKKFSLQWRDVIKSLVLSVISAVFTAIYETIEKDGDLSKLNFKSIGLISLLAAISYLFKNGVLEPPKTIVISPSNEEAKEATKEIKKAV